MRSPPRDLLTLAAVTLSATKDPEWGAQGNSSLRSEWHDEIPVRNQSIPCDMALTLQGSEPESKGFVDGFGHYRH
jgi:hypothetical protein